MCFARTSCGGVRLLVEHDLDDTMIPWCGLEPSFFDWYIILSQYERTCLQFEALYHIIAIALLSGTG